jgi:hypothetical protein
VHLKTLLQQKAVEATKQKEEKRKKPKWGVFHNLVFINKEQASTVC